MLVCTVIAYIGAICDALVMGYRRTHCLGVTCYLLLFLFGINEEDGLYRFIDLSNLHVNYLLFSKLRIFSLSPWQVLELWIRFTWIAYWLTARTNVCFLIGIITNFGCLRNQLNIHRIINRLDSLFFERLINF